MLLASQIVFLLEREGGSMGWGLREKVMELGKD
jgi:hypothetical protein